MLAASTQPDLVTDLTNLLKTWIPVAIALGAGVGSMLVVLYRQVSAQTQNGDGRTLRKAVDDLAEDFREHRKEVNSRLDSMNDNFSARLEAVERGR